MSTSNNDQFADWYRSANLNISEDIQTKRILAITAIVKNDDKAFWFDILRVYFGLQPKLTSNFDAFIKAFKDADGVFPLKGNENELQTLAGIAICYKIDANTFVSDTLSQALVTGIFLGQYSLNPDIPVLNRALNQVKKESINERTATLDDELTSINELITELTETPAAFTEEQSSTIAEILKQTISAYSAQSEELNVLWWVFGETSDSLNIDYKEMPAQIVPAFAGLDLFKLNEFTLGLVRAKSILQKLINSIAGKSAIKKTSVFELINNLSTAQKNVLLSGLANFTEFTPCLTALKFSLSFEAGLDWSGSVKNSIGNGDIKKQFLPVEIANQFYKEFILLGR